MLIPKVDIAHPVSAQVLPKLCLGWRHVTMQFFPGTDRRGGVARPKIFGVVRLCMVFLTPSPHLKGANGGGAI